MFSLKKTRDKKSAPTKKRRVPIATKSGVNGRNAMHASKGKSDSGIWSKPVNLLLLDIPSLRFTKLEKRSPVIAAAATMQPITHGRPTSGAHILVIARDRMIPLKVLDEPKRGLPSGMVALPSSGMAPFLPKSFAAITGVPLATASRATS